MDIMDASFRRRLADEPGETYRVIVRTDEEASRLADQCERDGLTVHRQFRLVPGLALSATGEALLALARDPHVTHIEPDHDVSL